MSLPFAKSGTRAWAHGLVDTETGMACDFPPSAWDAAVPTALAVAALLCLSLGSPGYHDRVTLALVAVVMSFVAVRRWFAFARDLAEHRAAVRRAPRGRRMGAPRRGATGRRRGAQAPAAAHAPRPRRRLTGPLRARG